MSITILRIVSVVIGLVFSWLVLSLAVMYIQEWIAARLNWRSRMLEGTIFNMLTDAALTDQLFNHPLIRSLYNGQDNTRKPSYIPSNQFASSLLDIAMNSGTEASLVQQQLYKFRNELHVLRRRSRKMAQKRLNLILALTRRALVSEADGEVVTATLDTIKSEMTKFADDFPKLKPEVGRLLDTVKVQHEQIEAALTALKGQMGGYRQESTFDKIRAGMVALSMTHPRLKQTLQALFEGMEEFTPKGENLLARARQNIEEWFNDSMSRLSGWYKRRVMILSFIIGIFLAAALNVDSLRLASQLWLEPEMRAALIGQAEAYMDQNQDDVLLQNAGQFLLLEGQLAEANLPVGWIGMSITPVMAHTGTESTGAEFTCTLNPQATGEVFGLMVNGLCYPVINSPRFNDLTGWLIKFLGLLATGLAAAQGAPFWFDVLKKVINVRATGLKPTETFKTVQQ